MQYLYRCSLLLALAILPAITHAQVSGCTDPAANNYSTAATRNDGSCTYNAVNLTPALVGNLSDTIKETSGLIFWNGYLWTHNDDTDTSLYAVDTANGRIVRRIAIAGAANHDWEEITQDDNYIYIGDFGNNANGNRQDLAILRIAKAAITAGQTGVTPDVIRFSYADQTSLAPAGSNNTDFDCEAFIATTDSLYLFTKQWVSGNTRVYALPKVPGIYSAVPKATYNVDGLITGATYIASRKLVALCGYKKGSALYQPFVWLLYDFSGTDFFGANKRRILVDPLLYQTEGIATADGKRFFISNELRAPISPTLRVADFGPYLNPYYTLAVPGAHPVKVPLTFYPNPAKGSFSTQLKSERSGTLHAVAFNAAGQSVGEEIVAVRAGDNKISLQLTSGLPAGNYWIRMSWNESTAWGRICVE